MGLAIHTRHFDERLRDDALAIFAAATERAHAGRALRNHLTCDGTHLHAGELALSLSAFDHVDLLCAGKASVEMAHAIEEIVGERLRSGIAVTKLGHNTTRLRVSQVFQAGHPVPDEAGAEAARCAAALVSPLGARDLLIVGLSGGASALLPAPAPGITLGQKQAATDLLLRCGATIQEINAVRKHLSTLKGGQLTRLAAPATVLSLIVSDVIGDPPDVIGSGLTVPDNSTFSDALAVLERYDLEDKVPAAVLHRLAAGARGALPETPKPDDPVFLHTHTQIIMNNQLALQAARTEAERRGYSTQVLDRSLSGEARETASARARLLKQLLDVKAPGSRQLCMLSGGETTVILRGNGKGGRNTEFALAAALQIDGLPNVAILSAGTDGTDGPTDAAGAIATGDTLARARSLGMDPQAFLDNNDSYTFFERLEDLVKTGPTGTNVMDVQVMLAG